MKKRVSLMLVSFMIFVAAAIAQEVPAGLTNAFKHGSADELSSFMGSHVEIIQPDGTKDYDKDGAKQFMATFFANNKVKGFNINHQGKRDESGFIVGTLATSEGTYRKNCFFKKTDNNFLIHQIRIDKTNE